MKMRYHVNTSGFGRQLSVQLISIITFSRLGQKNAVFKVTRAEQNAKAPGDGRSSSLAGSAECSILSLSRPVLGSARRQ